jgi:hypothetical protein
MRKKLVAILMLAAMLVVSGPLEIFAAEEAATTGDATAVAVENEDAVVTAQEAGDKEVPNFRALANHKCVILKWSKVEGAESYRVTVSGNGLKNKQLLDANKLTVTHKGLPVDDVINTKSGPKMKSDYTYKIVALDGSANEIAASTVKGYPVRALYYKITFKKAATLTSHTGGSKKTTFKAGQVVYAKGFTSGKYIFDYKCKDGKVRTYHSMKIRVKAALWKKHIDVDKTYTEEEATLYVNKRGLKSSTKYLIWVNPYTQKEYIFKGKKGKWKLVKGPWVVSTGRATMPTATGSTAFRRKLPSQHGTPYWNVTDFFSIHGKQKRWPDLGWPQSGACVRNTTPHAKWIYNTCPLRTRVFVF